MSPRPPNRSAGRAPGHRVAELLSHVAATVPFYASLRRRDGVPPPLEDFEPIAKREYVTHLDDLLSSAYADYERTDDLDVARRPNTLLFEFTSGSSGYPLRTYKTSEERARMAFSLLRKRKAVFPGFTPDGLFGFIHNPSFPASSHLDGLGNLSPSNIDRILSWLRDVERPTVLHGNPMLLLRYADRIAESGFDFGGWRPVFVESVSEPLTEAERSHIAEQFGARVVDCYGCLECYNVAYECPGGRLHVNENVVVEILDPADNERLAPNHDGEVVLTSLVNRAQPFVRYRTGDLGRLREDDCSCRSRQPVLELTGKRKIDYVKLLLATEQESLTICGYDYFWSVMHRLALEQRDAVAWFNVVQKELDLFEVQVLPKDGFDHAWRGRFVELAREQLGEGARFEFVVQDADEVLLINRKARVFRSLLQSN